MRVGFQADALNDEASWKHLDQILLRIDSGAHEWDVDEPEIIEESDWLRKGRKYQRELFEKSAKKAVYPRSAGSLHTRQISVTFQPVAKPDFGLPPERASTYLEQPLTILVENRFSDRLFGTTVMDLLGSPELTDFRQKVPNALVFDGGGGNGEIPKILKDYIDKNKASGIPVRVIVFTDSDGSFPGNCSPNAQTVREACKENDVPCLLLKKRAIENYIPDEIFESWAGTSNQKGHVAALLRLTPEQRDHFPMKKGFPADVTKLTPQETALYASVSNEDKVTLQAGFGNEVIKLLETQREKLSKEGLQKRDTQGELVCLVDMIVQEI